MKICFLKNFVYQLSFVAFLLPTICFSAVHNITSSSLDASSPSLFNGTIAWVSSDGEDQDIFYWNGSTTYKITNDPELDESPSLYNGTIAWTKRLKQPYDKSASEIYYWDGNEIQNLTNSARNEYTPSLYNGTIAWAVYKHDSNYKEIFYWDGRSIITGSLHLLLREYP